MKSLKCFLSVFFIISLVGIFSDANVLNAQSPKKDWCPGEDIPQNMERGRRILVERCPGQGRELKPKPLPNPSPPASEIKSKSQNGFLF